MRDNTKLVIETEVGMGTSMHIESYLRVTTRSENHTRNTT